MSSDATQSVGVYDVLAWLETNKKPLIAGFVAAVVVGFAIATYRYATEKKEVTASNELLKLRATLSERENAGHVDPSAFLRIADQYSGTDAAERALLMAGTSLFAEGKYSEAHTQFVRFLRDHAQSTFAATAAYGIAASLEAEGKQAEALTAYENLPVRYPNSTILDDAKLATGRIYEAMNKPAQALHAYEDLIKAGAMSTAGSEAVALKAGLLTRHPELAKTNNPVASPVPATGNMTNLPAAPATNAAAPAQP